MINFDNAATSFPKPQAVKAAVGTYFSRYGGNPGRGGHRLSMLAAEAVYGVREKTAAFFGAEPENVIFTQNCTHALNLAVKGIMNGSGHIIISSLEHNSVSRPVFALAQRQSGISYSVAEVFDDDDLTVQSFEELISADTKLIVCTIASNVTGQRLPVKRIGRLCSDNGICFVADGAQACGVIPVSLGDGINILCTSGHKSLFGMTGTGLLITDGQYPINPLMEGGSGSTSLDLHQPDFLPDRLEAGTINTSGIISLGAGLDFILGKGLTRIHDHEQRLCEQLISGISCGTNRRITVFRNRTAEYLPIVSFTVADCTSNEAASLLSEKGFALRGGLHCSGLAHRYLGTAPDGTVRFSPSVFNTSNEVSALISAIKKL